MANLLHWLGNGVKRLENTVNNDVFHPIQRDVFQPVQRAVGSPPAPRPQSFNSGGLQVNNQPNRQQIVNRPPPRPTPQISLMTAAHLPTIGLPQSQGPGLHSWSPPPQVHPQLPGLDSGLKDSVLGSGLKLAAAKLTHNQTAQANAKQNLAQANYNLAHRAADPSTAIALASGAEGGAKDIGRENLPVIKSGKGLPSVPLKNFDKTELNLHGKDIGAVGQSHFAGIAQDAIPLANKADLNKVGVLSQASKLQAVRADANKIMYGLSDRVGSSIKDPQAKTAHRLDYFNKLSNNLQSSGTPEGIHLQAEINKITGTKPPTAQGAKPNVPEVPKMFYRGGPDSEMPKGLTAHDVVNYERKDLGNADVKPMPGVDLKSVPSDKLMWVTGTKKAASEYGSAYETGLSNPKIIATDGQGGYLVDTRITQPTQVAKLPPPSAPKSVALSPQELSNLKKQGFDDKTIAKMAGSQGEKVAPPPTAPLKEIVRTPGSPKIPQSRGNLIPQVSSEGRLTKFTSLANRLERSGVGGQGALQVIRDKEIAARIHTQQLADHAQPFFKLSEEQQAAAIKVHKGEFSTKDPAVQAGADSLRTMFQAAHQRALNAKIKVGNQGANYFPQSYPRQWFKNPKTINKAAQQLVADGKAPDLETAIGKLNKIKLEGSVSLGTYGHFKPRTTDIPGIENAKTVTNYIRGASDAIAAAEHFGPKNGVLKGHIANAVRHGEDATTVRDVVSNYLHPNRPGGGAVSRGLSGYQKGLRVLQLPRAAISHGPQGIANTASDIGYKNYFKSLGQKINMSSEDKRFLNANGFRSEKVAPPEGLAGKATAPGLGHLLQFHRDVAALGGRNMALHAAEKGDAAALKNMGVSGKLAKGPDGQIKLSEAQQAQAGHFEANKSIGSPSHLESPSWTQTDAGKAVGMYRKMYTFKQAERIGNWLSEARNGHPGPLIRYLAIGVPVSGATVALAKGQIKDPGSNPLTDKKKLAGDVFHNSGLGSAGYGLVDSGVNAAMHNYGNDSRWSNAAGAASPGAGFAVQTGQHLAKGLNGNWQPLKRQGLQSLPVGGTALANKFAPNTPYQTDHGVGVSGQPVNPGIYQGKAKDGSTRYKTLQGSNMGSFGSLKEAQAAQAKNIFKYSDKQQTTINGKPFHKTDSGRVEPGPTPLAKSLKDQIDKGAQQPYKGIYQVKGKNGATRYATLQDANFKAYKTVAEAGDAQAKNIFKYSDKDFDVVGGNVYQRTAGGGVSVTPKLKYDYTSNSEKLTAAKASGDMSSYVSAAQDQLNNISSQLADPKLNSNDAQKLANQAQTLQSEFAKYQQYGGFDKPAHVASYKNIGTISGAQPGYTAAITQSAAKYGLDINAVLAVAAQEGLGGGVGDGGTSFGPFQLHVGGALPAGKDRVWAESPAGIDYALNQISKVAAGKTGAEAIAAIVNGFERPANPGAEAANALAVYSGGSARLASGSPGSASVTAAAGSAGGSGSKAVASFKTAKAGKLTAPAGIKVKKLAAAKFKAAKTRKLSVSKIPSNYLNKKIV
jgi:hypothetical protein